MKKIMIMAISMIGVISSCQKEIKNHDSNTEKIQAKPFDREAINTNSLKYPEIGKIIKETIPVVRQTIENLKLEYRQKIDNSGVMEKGSPGAAIIHIPADYPTLQQAITHAPQNGKIIVTGTVSDLGDVLVNVPGLIIQGENETSTINGNRLFISAPGVTVKNLNINMGIIISGTSNETLVYNKINSMVNVAGFVYMGVIPFFMGVLIDQSSNCILKNNEINGHTNDLAINLGILINEGSGNTIESTNVSFNPANIPNTIFFEGIHAEESNSNKITNCNIKSNISLNSEINSFGIYVRGLGNEVTNCKAENVSGPFALFGDNNKINYCEARIFKWSGFEANGNNNQIKNCKADGNLIGSYSGSNFGLRGFACIYGENNIFENCEAKNNEVGLELAFKLSLLNMSFPPGTTNLGHRVSKCNLSSNNSYGLYLYKSTACTLQENICELNGIIGINLVEASNSTISKNSSKNNTSCDFNQTNCTGNTIKANQFGSICTQLPWVGPF